MTQEEKELLLKDLGGRLAHHPVIYGKEGTATNEGVLTSVMTSGVFINTKGGGVHHYFIEEVKPYLRPMSSMTKEERKEFDEYTFEVISFFGQAVEAGQLTDWLNAHHFDYRGLIPMGLALEAPKGMY